MELLASGRGRGKQGREYNQTMSDQSKRRIEIALPLDVYSIYERAAVENMCFNSRNKKHKNKPSVPALIVELCIQMAKSFSFPNIAAQSTIVLVNSPTESQLKSY